MNFLKIQFSFERFFDLIHQFKLLEDLLRKPRCKEASGEWRQTLAIVLIESKTIVFETRKMLIYFFVMSFNLFLKR